MYKDLITSEQQCYNFRISKGRIDMFVHFCTGWQLIGFLSNINAEAQNN